jgi:hypothetical protein
MIPDTHTTTATNTTDDTNPTPTYHWTPASQRAFLAHLAVEGSVRLAAAHVAMSPRAAYDLRYRREGMAFRMGWAAAILIARDRLSDDLIDRALHPITECYSRSAPDAEGRVHIKRERHDNRLGMACLARLDRMHEASSTNADERFLAKTVSENWGAVLDLIGADEAEPGANNALFARFMIAAMQRCNAFGSIWSEAQFECEVAQINDALADDAEADAAQREAAEEARWASKARPPISMEEEAIEAAAEMDVWYCSTTQEWRTDFPPEPDFDGFESVPFGDDNYERELSEAELEIHEATTQAAAAPLRAAGEAARRAWFGLAEAA